MKVHSLTVTMGFELNEIERLVSFHNNKPVGIISLRRNNYCGIVSCRGVATTHS
jgi:hypothetical protein